MAPEHVLLHGAPDHLIGNSDAWKSSPVQVMQLEMSNHIVDELVDCLRRNKSPQVIFGRNPKLQYDGKSLSLQAFEEKVGASGSHELYKVDDQGKENEWSFAGIINYNLVTIQKVEEASAGADKAMEQLRSTQALAKQEIEARKPVVSTPEMRASQGRKGLSKAQARASLLNPLSGRSSPALGASTPSHLPAPTSAGLDSNMPMAIAGKKVLIHLLAVKPQTYETCRKLLHFNCRDILEKVGKKNDAGEWTLIDRAYKELDVWKFNYQKDEEREAAVQGAIRAYDRLRLSKEDKLWQMLLPQEERGKGVVLSRLNIKNVADAAGTIPGIKATTYNKKTGLPKKTAERKKADKDTVKAKKAKDGEAESAKTVIAPKPRTTKDAVAKERLAAKRKERASKDDERTPTPKKAKPSTAAKGLLNKPKNPSPLSASPPVNASDFEDGHPVHKALSAVTSPEKVEKRKATDMNGSGPPQRSTQQTNGVNNNNKRRQLDSSSNSSNSPSSSQSQVHHSTNTKQSNGLITNGYARPRQPKHEHSGPHSPDTSDSSQERSPPMKLSWKQSMDLAKRFKTYYGKYKLLHEELASSDLPPSEKKRMELISMRETLERMKRQVREGAL